jgi:tetratricopeptide (TPR) repeat protein
LDSYEQALALSKRAAGSPGDPVVLKQLGITYETLGLYANALASYEASIEAAESINDDLAKASALVNLGNVHYQLGTPNEAESSYQTALQIFADLGDQQGEAGASRYHDQG